ncbi:MAG: FkbM family methyltransferase [bacterium]
MTLDVESWIDKKVKRDWLTTLRFRIAYRGYHFLLLHRFKGSKYIQQKLCQWLVPRPKGLTPCPTLFGIEILVDPIFGRGLEKQIYYHGLYESGTLSILKKFLRIGDKFLDIGANIGWISCVVSRFVGKTGQVYAFEPHCKTFKILENNIKINDLNNISTFDVALGSKISRGLIHTNHEIGRGGASLLPPDNRGEDLTQRVEITTVDTLIENNQLDIPHVIKIDVEGYELEVLKGAINLLSGPNAPILIIEYSRYHAQHGGNTHDIYRFIHSLKKYSIYKLKYSKEIPSDLVEVFEEKDLPRHDNLFCFLDKHLNK